MSEGSVDEKAEQEMFDLVNKERVKAGISALTFDISLRDVGRSHSKDVFVRGYFLIIRLRVRRRLTGWIRQELIIVMQERIWRLLQAQILPRKDL